MSLFHSAVKSGRAIIHPFKRAISWPFDTLAGLYLLRMWAQVKGSHRGERG